MKEIEAKFADIDPENLRRRLQVAGFSLVLPETLMKRTILYHDGQINNCYTRVRDEGYRITMTIKKVRENDIDGIQEAEINIGDFDQGVKFLEMAGWQIKPHQETKREIWHHSEINAEITIDTWPGLPTFCEIEAPTKEEVKKVAESLGFQWENAFFGTIQVLYHHYLKMPFGALDTIPVLTFDNLDGLNF